MCPRGSGKARPGWPWTRRGSVPHGAREKDIRDPAASARPPERGAAADSSHAPGRTAGTGRLRARKAGLNPAGSFGLLSSWTQREPFGRRGRVRQGHEHRARPQPRLQRSQWTDTGGAVSPPFCGTYRDNPSSLVLKDALPWFTSLAWILTTAVYKFLNFLFSKNKKRKGKTFSFLPQAKSTVWRLAPCPGKLLGSTSNSVPSRPWPRLFREVTVPFPRPRPYARLLGLPAGRCTHGWNCSPGAPSFLHFHLGKSPAPLPASRYRRALSFYKLSPSAQGHFRPLLDASGAKNPELRTRGRSPGGRGGGAQARSVPRWAPGRPGCCLLPLWARRTPRADGGRPTPRRPSGGFSVLLRHGRPADQVPSGDFDLFEVGWGRAPSLSLAAGPCPSTALVAGAPSPPGGGRVSEAATVSRGPGRPGPRPAGIFSPSPQAAQVPSAAGNLPVCPLGSALERLWRRGLPMPARAAGPGARPKTAL